MICVCLFGFKEEGGDERWHLFLRDDVRRYSAGGLARGHVLDQHPRLEHTQVRALSSSWRFHVDAGESDVPLHHPVDRSYGSQNGRSHLKRALEGLFKVL